jgi:aldehyde dehydrogenase (NAD+)
MREGLYIGGRWRSGTGNSEIEVVSPAAEEAIARIPGVSEKDLEGAILAARRAVEEGP